MLWLPKTAVHILLFARRCPLKETMMKLEGYDDDRGQAMSSNETPPNVDVSTMGAGRTCLMYVVLSRRLMSTLQ